MTRDDALAQVQKLLNLSTTTGPEGEAALRRAHVLMDKHGITDRDLRAAAAKKPSLFDQLWQRMTPEQRAEADRIERERQRRDGESDDDWYDRINTDIKLWSDGARGSEWETVRKRVRARRYRQARAARSAEQLAAEAARARDQRVTNATKSLRAVLDALDELTADDGRPWTIARLQREMVKRERQELRRFGRRVAKSIANQRAAAAAREAAQQAEAEGQTR